jgi:signal transduction histidine kinase
MDFLNAFLVNQLAFITLNGNVNIVRSAGERIISLETQRVILIALVVVLCLTIVLLILLKKQRPIEPKAIAKKNENFTQQLVESYFKGQDNERARIAKELHDGACSGLLGVRYLIEPFTFDNPELKKASVWLESIHSELRNISHNLAPKELFQTNLAEALELLLSRLCKQAGKTFTFSSDSTFDWKSCPNVTQQNAYRIIQELIGNIIKHSNAQQVDMIIMGNCNQVIISIEDDSSNFAQTKGNGIGLESIISRIEIAKGKIDISKTTSGVVYQIEVPLS